MARIVLQYFTEPMQTVAKAAADAPIHSTIWWAKLSSIFNKTATPFKPFARESNINNIAECYTKYKMNTNKL